MHHLRVLLALFAAIETQAQTAAFLGNMAGNLRDAARQPVDAASITLHRTRDSSFVKAALSDEAGHFELENIGAGTYFLRVSHLLFQPFASEAFEWDATHTAPPLSDLSLVAKTHDLKEVRVTAQKQFVERHLDKIVVNVENSIVAAGNSVLEVLERAPNVLVNQESGLHVKGKSGVLVMIDGKPSPLSGSDLLTYLRSIPASNIQAIEIITNPSARYDAAGNAGIINIKFKKDQRQGLNGSFTASYGQGELPKPSAAMNFNYRKKAWNLFGAYSKAIPTQLTRFYINRKFFNTDGSVNLIFDQDSYIRQPINSDNVRLGLDYYWGKKTIVGVLFNGNWNHNQREGVTNTHVIQRDETPLYTTKTDIALRENRVNAFGNFNFKHTFNEKGTDLTVDLDYGRYTGHIVQDIINENFSPENIRLSGNLLLTDQNGALSVKSAKADFAHPLSENAKWEAGVKSSLVTSDNDVQFFDVINGQNQLDPTNSNRFLYEENINAAYTSYAKTLKKTDFQVGLRMEHTHTTGRQLTTGEVFSRNYINWFPTAALNWKQSERNTFSLSFSRRIDRPGYRQLNPFKL